MTRPAWLTIHELPVLGRQFGQTMCVFEAVKSAGIPAVA